ncbi:hypothetical protein CABS01_16063 [Colletotrichum abscissum]|uniref:Uncharacterized protein n=1 Tax=Colletotrichum abscissum TaxID=1671311 RepID=A0A9P9X3M3_9PEZI|nr:uncharacterized protein CABS01_16063 [Colletotrichum abscissum]KAI3534974.1 hypothetical protein CABS02_13071 [Colletotrichum abscissum]KAK1473162.1 hypothetical protein CABS01_16063 [Colletotrichum abscissum]
MISVVKSPAHAPLIFKQRLDPTVLSVTAEVTITLFSSGRMNPLIAPGAECFTCTISNWADQLVVTGNIEKETSRAGQGQGRKAPRFNPPPPSPGEAQKLHGVFLTLAYRQQAEADLSSEERQCPASEIVIWQMRPGSPSSRSDTDE